MAFDAVGKARTEIEFLNFSQLIGTGIKGISAVLGVTERGAIGKSVLVSNWLQYQENFGGLQDENLFPLIARRSLESGGRLRVSPIGHYLDINDATTLMGSASAVTVTEALQVEVLATGTITIATVPTVGATVTARANNITIGTYVVQGADDADAVAAGLAADIAANTGGTGYTGAAAAAVVTVTAPVGSGSSLNARLVVSYASDGSGEITVTNLAGGIPASDTINLTAEASSIGDWSDGKLWFSIAPAANGLVDTFDISIGLDGYPTLGVTIPNVNKIPTANEWRVINARQRLIEFDASTFTGELRELPRTNLTGGTKDDTQITVFDYIGAQISSTGLYSLDTDKDFVKLAAPAIAIPQFDAALSAYVTMRQDCLGVTRTPIGLDANGVIDYREGQGAWSHEAIDNWRMLMFTGGLEVNHPEEEFSLQIPELGDVLGRMGAKDNQYAEWFTFGGQKRGRIPNSLGVVYDLGSPARETDASRVSIHGVNAVINHATFGTVIWDNVTMSKSNSLFKFANVAELLIYLYRAIKPVTEEELFDPNDIELWKQIYRRVRVVMEFVQASRAIWRYRYEGDQDIERVEDAVVNDPNQIDQGQIIFNLFFAPKVGAKFIGMRGIVTGSGVDFDSIDV